ncbi:uncharacterized protein [Solanum lycopersicum]|uniref:uncharacterized protein n=1 Tax=Solanum lycopersicum TaxID=4081 RepID=UPI003748BC61
MSNIDEDKNELVKELNQLARLGVRMEDAASEGVSVHSRSESSFVVDVKANQHLNPVLMELKDSILSKLNELFSLEGDGLLRYQNRLYMPTIDNLRTNILAKAHGSRHSIHLGAKKMYHDFKEDYWWEGMKRDMSKFVEECPNCQ